MTTSVLVLGAGFGGLELSSRLAQELGDQVEITLIDRADAFVFGFSKLDVMFGKRTLEAVRLPYRDLATPHVRFLQETITAIDPDARRVVTDRGTYEADVLVVALGADYDLAATPGLAEAGHEFYSVAGARGLRDVLPRSGRARRSSASAAPRSSARRRPARRRSCWTSYLRERGVRDDVRIQVVIPFGTPVPPSPATSEAILARFAERGIEFVRDRGSPRLTRPRTRPCSTMAARLPFDLFLGVPVHRAPAVVEASGLAEGGWIPVDPGHAGDPRSRASTRWATSRAWARRRRACSPRARRASWPTS